MPRDHPQRAHDAAVPAWQARRRFGLAARDAGALARLPASAAATRLV
ncbi:MAG: hypothetical protein K8W52_12685 [Deltaproteobacteria bacterium]|nr:hypothetical protein [Deltaproteobacteria bacterium]